MGVPQASQAKSWLLQSTLDTFRLDAKKNGSVVSVFPHLTLCSVGRLENDLSGSHKWKSARTGLSSFHSTPAYISNEHFGPYISLFSASVKFYRNQKKINPSRTKKIKRVAKKLHAWNRSWKLTEQKKVVHTEQLNALVEQYIIYEDNSS